MAGAGYRRRALALNATHSTQGFTLPGIHRLVFTAECQAAALAPYGLTEMPTTGEKSLSSSLEGRRRHNTRGVCMCDAGGWARPPGTVATVETVYTHYTKQGSLTRSRNRVSLFTRSRGSRWRGVHGRPPSLLSPPLSLTASLRP